MLWVGSAVSLINEHDKTATHLEGMSKQKSQLVIASHVLWLRLIGSIVLFTALAVNLLELLLEVNQFRRNLSKLHPVNVAGCGCASPIGMLC